MGHVERCGGGRQEEENDLRVELTSSVPAAILPLSDGAIVVHDAEVIKTNSLISENMLLRSLHTTGAAVPYPGTVPDSF